MEVDVATDQAVESIDAGIVVSRAHRGRSLGAVIDSDRAFTVTYGSR